jgi:hypothetical protein
VSGTLGHLPGFTDHRKDVEADGAGAVPVTTPLNCRGYEKVLLYLETDVLTHVGTANLEAYLEDETEPSSPKHVSVWTQAGATEYTGYEVTVYGGKLLVAVRAFGGGATTATIRVAGAVPEAPFNG